MDRREKRQEKWASGGDQTGRLYTCKSVLSLTAAYDGKTTDFLLGLSLRSLVGISYAGETVRTPVNSSYVVCNTLGRQLDKAST